MELLDIQIDLFHFKGLLDSIGTENQENTHEQLSGRLLYYISKYKNSPSVTMQKANLMLSHVERLFKLMIVYKPEEFMECLLNTNAGNELRKKGIGAVLERKFATLIPLDKLYLLYLEYYCRELVIQGNLSESVRSDTEKVLRTVDEIREAERIYAEQMPVDTLLLKVFDKMFEGKIKLETSERIDLLAGRGRLSLTVVPQSENNNKQLAQMKIACKPISEGVAHLSKIGVYDNLGVDAVAKNERYMVARKIPFAVNEKSYLIGDTKRNMLMSLSYRDLTTLWPSVRYFIVSQYAHTGEDEQQFKNRKDFCHALAQEDCLSPLGGPVSMEVSI